MFSKPSFPKCTFAVNKRNFEIVCVIYEQIVLLICVSFCSVLCFCDFTCRHNETA